MFDYTATKGMKLRVKRNVKRKRKKGGKKDSNLVRIYDYIELRRKMKE